MAVFDTSDLSQTATSSVTPKQGVADKSSLIQYETASQVLGLGLKVTDNILKKNAADAAAANKNAFATQQLDIASAVERGDISAAEGRRKMRVNATRAMAAGMNFDDLKEVQGGIMSTSGFGKVVAEGTQEEQDYVKLVSAAKDAGFIPANATEQQTKEGLEMWQKGEKAKNVLAVNNSELQFKTGKINLETKIRQNDSRIAVGELGQTYYYSLNNRMRDIMKGLESNQYTQEEALTLIEQASGPMKDMLSSVGAESGDVLSNMTDPIESMVTRYKDAVTGKIGLDVLKNEIDKNMTIQTALITADPDTAKAAAISKLFHGAISIRPEIEVQALKHITRNTNSGGSGKTADLFPGSDQERLEVAQVFDFMRDNIKDVNKSLDPELHTKNMSQQMESIVQGVVDHSGSIKSVKEYNQMVEFLSSPEVGAFTEKTGGVDANIASEAKIVLKEQYENVVVPLLRDEYEGSNLTGAVEINGNTKVNPSATEVVEPVFTGAGVSFQPKEGVRLGRGAMQSLRTLNKRVTPQLNRMIRMGAHLDGNRNYKAVYEQNYLGIFGQELENDEAE